MNVTRWAPGVEVGVCVIQAVLLIAMIAFALRIGGGSYTEHLSGLVIMILIGGSMNLVCLVALVVVATKQHRVLRHVARGAAVMASARRSDKAVGQIAQAADHLDSVARTLNELLRTEMRTAELLEQVADRFDITVATAVAIPDPQYPGFTR